MATNFPSKGEDKKVTLRNSERPQFDFAFAEALKADFPKIWKAGGNIRGNEAFNLWVKARAGDYTDTVTAWVKEREAWAARHAGDGSQFPEDEPNLSNIAGVVAAMKWGVILDIGESAMKRAVNAVKAKQEGERHLVAIVDEGDHYVLKFAKMEEEPSPFEVTDVDNPHANEPETDDPPASTEGGGGGGGRLPQDQTQTVRPPTRPTGTGDDPRRPVGGGRDHYEDEEEEQEEEREVSARVRKSLEKKADDHNATDPKHRTTVRTLEAVFKRGVGAYKTNPQSVRPGVSGPDQWAHARVNSFIYALKNEKFRSGKHDTDLLPDSHPLASSEKAEAKSQDMDKSIERRFIGTTTLELREAGPEGRRAEGYAAVFNSPTTIQTLRGSFREVLTREAFEGRLEDNVLALFNHDQASPLAKVGAGLELSLDDYGLRYSFPIPDTTTGRDLIELMDRGIVKDASFAFTVGEDGQRWERDEEADVDVRTITKLNRLVDVSVVTIGAYPDATSALRSFEGANFNELPTEGSTPHSAQDTPAKEPQTAPEQTLSLGGLRSAIIRAKSSNF